MTAPGYGFLRANALSLVFGALFIATLFGQAIAGTADFNAQQLTNGLPTVSFLDYVTSSSFGVDVMENWQSEYLQFSLYVFATVWLVQRGSSESKEPAQEGTESDREQMIGPHAVEESPAWARTGGWRTALFSRSLGLLMSVLFLLTWAASSVAGWAAYNAEQLGQRQDPVSYVGYLGEADCSSTAAVIAPTVASASLQPAVSTRRSPSSPNCTPASSRASVTPSV